MKSQHTVVIAISSGVAAYKVVDLIKIIRSRNIAVEIIMTKSAVAMFGKEMFEKAVGKKVYTDLISNDFDYRQVLEKKEVEHIKLADSASLFVVSPATANVIGKIAGGIADDFLTTILLAVTCPVLICPSMNVNMWNNPLVQDNLMKLKKLGYYIFPPDKGQLACGYEGIGRLADPKKIVSEILQLLNKRKQLKGKKIIVTAGGTSEAIDAVRTITNRASGKMGVAIAEVCHRQGADLLLICSSIAVNHIKVPWKKLTKDTSGVAGKQGFPRGGGIKVEIFETAKDLEELVKTYIKNYDIIFHTAAVSDFIPEKFIDDKIDSQKPITIRLRPTTKILHQIKKWNAKILLVGFKAVYKKKEEDLIKIGIKKLKESNSDFIIVNDVGRKGIGFAVDTNEVYIISQKGFLAKISKNTKIEVAKKIIDAISI